MDSITVSIRQLHKMTDLVDKIEHAMRTVNPFGFTTLGGGDYYYEANNMVRLLPTYRYSILELCMDSFDIYYDRHPIWTELENAITKLFQEENIIHSCSTTPPR
jgi:hypothetical protein